MTLFARKHPTYLIHLLPIYVAAVCAAGVHLLRGLQAYLVRLNPPAAIWAGRMAGVSFIAAYTGFMAVLDHPAYGFESRMADERTAHSFVMSQLKPGDVVMTSNPWVTYYYLRDFDFFIRQKRYPDGKWGAFPADRDEYYGREIVDTLPEFQDILNNPSHHRVWVIIDGKFFGATGREMIRRVGGSVRLVYGRPQRSQVLVGMYQREAIP
jgi:hypothetical protein